MKKLVTFLCVLITFSMLVSCGGQGTATNNEPKTTTTKTEDVVNVQKTEQVPEVKTTKPAETTKIDDKDEKILLELMTIKYMCDNYLEVGRYRDERHSIGYYSEIPFFIEKSKILNKELKNKLSVPLTDYSDNNPYGDAIFQAILNLEIEKYKRLYR